MRNCRKRLVSMGPRERLAKLVYAQTAKIFPGWLAILMGAFQSWELLNHELCRMARCAKAYL